MKIVGLNIAAGRVAASLVDKGLRQTELKSSFIRSFATDVELTDILKEAAREWAGCRIVSSIPGLRFSQRTLQFPFNDRKRIEKALPFELEDGLPFSLEDAELDYLVLDRAGKDKEKKKETSVLGVIAPKTFLRRHLDLLAAAGVDPQFVVPSYIGLYGLSKMVPIEGTAALIDGNDLCVKDGNAVLACRSFSGSQATAGLRHTLKALEIELGAPIEKACLLSPNEGLRAELADLGVVVEQVAPDFHGKTPEDPISLGLALSGEINLRKGEFSYRLAEAGSRKRKRTLIVAGALAAVIALADFGLNYYLIQSRYRQLDTEITAIFHQTMPEAKVVVDPVRQLRTGLEEAKKKFGVLGTGTSALDVMKAVTEGIPKEVRVSFQEFTLEGGVVKLQGEAPSFESVDKIKSELQKSPLFSDVNVLDTRMGLNNKVKFRCEIKVRQTQ